MVGVSVFQLEIDHKYTASVSGITLSRQVHMRPERERESQRCNNTKEMQMYKDNTPSATLCAIKKERREREGGAEITYV